MFYIQQAATIPKIIKMARHFSNGTHGNCAIAYIGKAFFEARLVCYSENDVRRLENSGHCFSVEDFKAAWQYLIDEELVKPIEIYGVPTRKIYVCPHLAIGVEYRNRGRLCEACKKELSLRSAERPGCLMVLTPEEMQIEYGEPVEWPDEIDFEEGLKQ